ncbi:hypothetical protein DDB_G0276219 [Dictyostelium discoideum AX4]|uniref:Uncharacterized protein n=1 Tax=Dictyostelium discoideum TaxID=44689 RepID=Q552D6_DICDI|nr:hypothetical protein DDB_G0276219 [Dictyostelium discoideum AX4]EAL69409.1 hypothetical protein DDB_G0276219 [Dictyostelium discoideum AX4]|eukprot:XP_643277.1 hypothetical protein DDB_G0276219 [Dictyostelium discoideum AX4]
MPDSPLTEPRQPPQPPQPPHFLSWRNFLSFRKFISWKNAFLILIPILLAIGIGNYEQIIQYSSGPIFIEKFDQYNVIINIKSILAIKEGWGITTDGSQFASMFVNQQSEYSKLLVALTGDYNSGKTFLINNLENKNFPSSYQHATPAFGFIQSSISDYIYMDTQGLKRLASSSLDSDRGTHSIKDIKAIDNLISQSYKVANLIIEVRDTGNNEDICNTQQRHAEYLQDSKANGYQIPVMVVVVHNFKNMRTVAEVEKYIRDDITNPEIGGQEKEVDSKTGDKKCKYWYVDSVLHYVIAQEGSEAGKVYNKCTFDLIRLKVLQDQGGIPKVNFLNKLTLVMEQSLRNYIKDPNVSKDSFVRVKKDETIVSYASYLKSFFSSKSDPEKPDQPTLIESHPFKVSIQNNKIKLVNSTFDLQFSYKDCCGFKNIDYSPQYDVIETSDSFSIVVDAPNSIVNWFCSPSESHTISFYIERKFPTYLSSHLRRNINPRTYGEIKKEFQIPSRPWIDCLRLIPTAKYIDGVAFVSLTKDSTVIGGSPFPEDKK